jgi:predicted ATP-grasp superfamily ATP-dependent carboligase
VTGNSWVHPGELNVTDDYETAYRLFELVNTVVELTIARDNLIEEQYAKVPENKMKGIEQRDGS